MMSMSRKLLLLMALVLAAATAATAATAFAGEKKNKNQIVTNVAKAIHTSADAALRTKVRTLRLPNTNTGTVFRTARPR